MSDRPIVVTTFKDLETDEKIREAIDARCAHLADEFREVTRFEITLTEDGVGFSAHGHATGKGRDVSARAEATELGPAVDLLLDKVHKQLRKVHDKQIFAQRRDAQRNPPKKS
jgi:ribosomal subunit interface protein